MTEEKSTEGSVRLRSSTVGFGLGTSRGENVMAQGKESNTDIDTLDHQEVDSLKKKRVLIVGAGAAGTAAAYSLSRHKEAFYVSVWEKERMPGGVACTVNLPLGTFVNEGVQGGCPSYRNTLSLMKEHGFSGHPVKMMVSFGKDETAWTNYTHSPLIERLQPEIKRFQRTLKTINRLETIFIFVPIAKVLKWFNYSDDFRNLIVFPLVALFFGTGNQTPNVSAAVIARVFLDDDLRLFDYDPEWFLSQSPDMFAFPNLEEMYRTILSQCGVEFHMNRPVQKIKRTSGKIYAQDEMGKEEEFDELIMACDAETALKVLDKPTFWERHALGNVKYYNDITITHEDEDYMNKHYELHKDIDQYFIRTDPENREKIEMSFNLSNYQPQLKLNKERNIYQTIFLDDKESDSWTIKEIKEDKILLRHWWRQFAHTWSHFAFTTPLVRYIQGTKHTHYAGSYTLINTHEIAVISGLAAAHRLGAPYPFAQDPLALKQFDQYMTVIYGKARNSGCNWASVKNVLLAPFARLFALLILLVGMCVQK